MPHALFVLSLIGLIVIISGAVIQQYSRGNGLVK